MLLLLPRNAPKTYFAKKLVGKISNAIPLPYTYEVIHASGIERSTRLLQRKNATLYRVAFWLA